MTVCPNEGCYIVLLKKTISRIRDYSVRTCLIGTDSVGELVSPTLYFNSKFFF